MKKPKASPQSMPLLCLSFFIGAKGLVTKGKPSLPLRVRITCIALLLGLTNSFAAQEELRTNSHVSILDETQKVIMPSGDGAWLVIITNSGGYFGSRRSLVVNSDGKAALGRRRPFACTARLSAEELVKVKRAVADIDASGWSCCANDNSGKKKGVDLTRTSVELRRQEGGVERTYRAVWYSGEENALPSDLIAVRDTLKEIEKRVAADCNGYLITRHR